MTFRNKKASLELSIRAIVIVVLAMTLLGLGLGFVRNIFKDISGISEDVSEQVRQKILDDLITGDKKVAFPRSEINTKAGDSEILTVGIRNKQSQILSYKMLVTCIECPVPAEDWFQYGKEKTYEVEPAESDIRNIRLSVPNNAASGSYFLTFDVNDINGKVYATKDFFIVVRG